MLKLQAVGAACFGANQPTLCYFGVQGTALVGRLWMQNVWGTAEAPLIIQRDPAAGPADPPSVLEVIDVFNCTYMYFKGITFKIQPPGSGNVVHFASR